MHPNVESVFDVLYLFLHCMFSILKVCVAVSHFIYDIVTLKQVHYQCRWHFLQGTFLCDSVC